MLRQSIKDEIRDIVHLSLDFCGNYFDTVKTYCSEYIPPLDPYGAEVQIVILNALDEYVGVCRDCKEVIKSDAV